MHSSVYLWDLRPESGLSLELRVVADNASVARREVRRFLEAHDGISWRIESVSREALYVPRVMFDLPAPRRLRSAR